VAGNVVQATRTIAAAWPDRAYLTTDLKDKNLLVRVWLRRPHITVFEGDREQENFNRTELELSAAADITAQHWMQLLVPLIDPKSVAFEFRATTGVDPDNGQSMPIHLMKLSIGKLPLFHLTFDAKTDLLLRVDYESSELGLRLRKQWTAREHKPGPDGLRLPTKTKSRHDAGEVEQWDVDKWEFPASIPDTEFEVPKK
jgi:hypothetical protein